jgi:hypothetical protein
MPHRVHRVREGRPEHRHARRGSSPEPCWRDVSRGPTIGSIPEGPRRRAPPHRSLSSPWSHEPTRTAVFSGASRRWLRHH